MAAEWKLVLCSATGEELTDIEVACTLRFERSRAASVKPKLMHDDRGAADLLDALAAGGIPQLRAYRFDSLPGALRFSGQWSPHQEHADDTDSTIDAEFRSPFARLERRHLTAQAVYTAQDAGLGIAWNLIAGTNAVSPTGLVQGSIDTTVPRDRTYGPGKQIAEAIIELTEDDGGFAFTETPLDPRSNAGALAQFNVHASLGQDRSGLVRFEFGAGTLANCKSVDREIRLPVNRAIVTGGQGTTPAVAEDTASIAARGLYDDTASFPDVTVQQTLQDKANGMLQPDPVAVVMFEPDPDDAPQPWEDYWLDDSAGFLADQDALQIQAVEQITAVEIDVDETGREAAHRLEFGLQTVLPLQPVRRGRRIRFRDQERR